MNVYQNYLFVDSKGVVLHAWFSWVSSMFKFQESNKMVDELNDKWIWVPY